MDLIKKQLLSNLKSLSKPEQIHIFNFLKINNHSITVNNNGVYFTLDQFSDKLLLKLNNLILNIIKNRENNSNFEEARQHEINTFKQTLVDKTVVTETNQSTLFQKISDHDSSLILEVKKIKIYSSSRYNSSTIDIGSRRKKKIKHPVFDRIFKRIRLKGNNKSEETGTSKCENDDMFDNNLNDNDEYSENNDNDDHINNDDACRKLIIRELKFNIAEIKHTDTLIIQVADQTIKYK